MNDATRIRIAAAATALFVAALIALGLALRSEGASPGSAAAPTGVAATPAVASPDTRVGIVQVPAAVGQSELSLADDDGEQEYEDDEGYEDDD